MRPAHFRGVASIVAKLFNAVQPDKAYFGQKDAQQAVVIRRMVQDLNFPLDVVVCPIVREADGLAMSSRNVYLNSEERRAASVLYRSLQAAQAALRKWGTQRRLPAPDHAGYASAGAVGAARSTFPAPTQTTCKN